MQNWQFHEEMKQLNMQSCQFSNLKEGMIVKGKTLQWRVESIGYDSATNFKGVAFSNGKNLVFSFVGTENINGEMTKNWGANTKMFFNLKNNQFSAGEDWYRSVSNDSKYKNYLKYNTGHSEGASESIMFAKKYGNDAVTFNSYNPRRIVENSPVSFSRNPKIVNYGIKQDATFNMGGIKNHLGETYVYKSPNAKSSLELKELHGLEQFPALNTFEKYDPTKINMPYELKPQNFSNESTGLSNSASVSNQLIQVPQNVPSLNLEYLAALGNLVQTTSVFGAVFGMVTGLVGAVGGAFLGSAVGNALKPGVVTGATPSITSSNSYVSGVSSNGIPLKFHSGGLVPGQGEVPAILKGGETVRTKAQEEELQQQLYQKYIGDFAPTVCGEQQNQQAQSQKNEQSQKPIHQQITKEDEMFILNLIADAIDRNRMGLRTKMQAL